MHIIIIQMHPLKNSQKTDSKGGGGVVNPYGQPNCKIPGFFWRLPLVVDGHVGEQVEWLGGAQGEGQGHQDVQLRI